MLETIRIILESCATNAFSHAKSSDPSCVENLLCSWNTPNEQQVSATGALYNTSVPKLPEARIDQARARFHAGNGVSRSVL